MRAFPRRLRPVFHEITCSEVKTASFQGEVVGARSSKYFQGSLVIWASKRGCPVEDIQGELVSQKSNSVLHHVWT